MTLEDNLKFSVPDQIVFLTKKVKQNVGEPILLIRRYSVDDIPLFPPTMATDLRLGFLKNDNVEYDGVDIKLKIGQFYFRSFREDKVERNWSFLFGEELNDLEIKASEYLSEDAEILPVPTGFNHDTNNPEFAISKILMGHHGIVPFAMIYEPKVWSLMIRAEKNGFTGQSFIRDYLDNKSKISFDYFLGKKALSPIWNIKDYESALHMLNQKLPREIKSQYSVK